MTISSSGHFASSSLSLSSIGIIGYCNDYDYGRGYCYDGENYYYIMMLLLLPINFRLVFVSNRP